ncbi:MAG: hypothetical protein V4502_07745 [Pseudomonadota bacterium]
MSAIGMLLAAVVGQGMSLVHSPAIEAHLAPLVGDWTRAGREATYRDNCVWYDRHAFVVCSLTDASSGLRVQATVGYSKDEQRFTYQSYANDGTSHVQYGYSVGTNGIVFTDERRADGKPVRLTTSMIPQADGRLYLAQERSVMGGPWVKAGEVYYVKRK